MIGVPFRAWSVCEAPGCDDPPAVLVVVRDVAVEWPELVDTDGAVRFVLCPDHARTLPAVARGSDGLEHDVERFGL